MILVTGGAGYIGSVLVPLLVKNNYLVRVFDALIFGSKSLDCCRNKIELIKGDIRCPPKNLFKGIKAVIHLAGLSNDPTANFDPKTNYQVNTLATINLAYMAKENKVERFIFGSSCSVYDQGLGKYTKLQDEKSPVNPTAPYSLSKLLAEENILPLADRKFCLTIVRKGTVVGFSPRMRYDLVVNTMVKDAFYRNKIKIFAKGKQWRPLIVVDDVVLAYLKLLQAPIDKINKEIFNVVAFNLQIIDVARKVQKTLIPFKKVFLDINDLVLESRSYKVSGRKIEKKLGFTPKWTIEKAILEIVKKIKDGKVNDFDNPCYYNIQWMKRQYCKEDKGRFNRVNYERE